MQTLLTSTAFFAPLRWYILGLRYGHWQLEAWENYQKGGFRNRCLIATANGPRYLSIPLEKGKHQATPIQAVRCSERSPWRRDIQQSLQSAYGRSPFFDFYAPSLFALLQAKPLPLHSVPVLIGGVERQPASVYEAATTQATNQLLEEPLSGSLPTANCAAGPLLWDINQAIFNFLQDSLQLPIQLGASPSFQAAAQEGYRDLRHKDSNPAVEPLPYPQLFADRYGFNPDLSILDLLFCLGPEANTYLRRCANQ